MRLLRVCALSWAILLLAASSASALTVPALSMTVSDGTTTKAWGASGTENLDGTYAYGGHLVTSKVWDIQWDVTADPDPSVVANAIVTNLTATTNTYTIIASFPLDSPLGPTTKTGGSVQGGFTDNNGNGATVSTSGSTPLYLAKIDGAPFQALYAAPTSASSTAFESGSFTKVAFGTPIPSFPGPAANSTIEIQLKFTLTPGDTATFSSVFVVEPVPEPTSLALLATGGVACGMVVVRRRFGKR